jgi:hypothetical protein
VNSVRELAVFRGILRDASGFGGIGNYLLLFAYVVFSTASRTGFSSPHAPPTLIETKFFPSA